MASILETFGIKEVADVVFYDINADGTPGAPVLYLDTLKVSTLEQTAETTYSHGGKGNPRLVGWDFGKEITLSLEDAVFSPKSLAIMFGDGTVDTDIASIRKTITAIATKNGAGGLPTTWTDANGNAREIPVSAVDPISPLYTAEDGTATAAADVKKGDYVFITFDVPIIGQTISVGASAFPGTYYITGDTYARATANGKDQYFQFIVPKGKVTSENTITMEADGDPSVFNLNVDVLRAGAGEMMKLVKYDLEPIEEEEEDGTP